MYKLDIPTDMKEAAAIDRRRMMEEQRKARIFNAKNRLIGIDEQALEQQIKDRQQMEEMEKRREEAFAADAARNDKIVLTLQQRQEYDQRELQKALNDFRTLHQTPEGRREWDLYDPESLKKDKPARVSDSDPRCGTSSLQKFGGEDLNKTAREKFQNEQMREWEEQQVRERKNAEERQKEANRLHDLKMKELNQRAQDLAKAEEECRKALEKATCDYNLELAKEQEARRNVAKQQENDDKLTELANHIYGDFLTENPAVAQSAFGPHRVISDRWKGMIPEQLADIRREQDLQRKEKTRLEDEKRRQDEEWDRQQTQQAKAAMLLQQEEERRNREIKNKIAEENRRLAQEQAKYKEYLDKQVYTNKPTAAYFMQFNTSSR